MSTYRRHYSNTYEAQLESETNFDIGVAIGGVATSVGGLVVGALTGETGAGAAISAVGAGVAVVFGRTAFRAHRVVSSIREDNGYPRG